jgi:hypothetical protein
MAGVGSSTFQQIEKPLVAIADIHRSSQKISFARGGRLRAQSATQKLSISGHNGLRE